MKEIQYITIIKVAVDVLISSCPIVDFVSESALRPAKREAKMLVEIASHR